MRRTEKIQYVKEGIGKGESLMSKPESQFGQEWRCLDDLLVCYFCVSEGLSLVLVLVLSCLLHGFFLGMELLSAQDFGFCMVTCGRKESISFGDKNLIL